MVPCPPRVERINRCLPSGDQTGLDQFELSVEPLVMLTRELPGRSWTQMSVTVPISSFVTEFLDPSRMIAIAPSDETASGSLTDSNLCRSSMRSGRRGLLPRSICCAKVKGAAVQHSTKSVILQRCA